MIRNFIAVDLGATSGRTILGTVAESGISLRELNRFPNRITRMGTHCYWNIVSLYENILEGLKIAAKTGEEITSIGVDTWGVDMVCIGKDGNLLGLPYSYRDPYTVSAPETFFSEVMARRELYEKTGIQILNFNTLFQLYAMKRDGSSTLAAADRILFLPDAFAYLLTGNMVTEYTIASTSQFVSPYTRKIDVDLLEQVGINPKMFAEPVMPGARIGVLRNWIAEECGLPEGIPVVAVAGHDTASAVVAVPATEAGFVYLSSGTWSLLGIETRMPVINGDTFASNITNEGGADGTIRLLKNITGLWLMEQCMKEWKKSGAEYTYARIVEMAGERPSFRSFIDPDDPAFANPESMPEAIADYCRQRSQPVPETHAEFIRCIFESLALKYRETIQKFRSYSDEALSVLHIIGGGARNALLNQYAANATGMKVTAGPAEATAIGNIMIQARAAGICRTIGEMRRIIARSVCTRTYFPEDREIWDRAYIRYMKLTKN